MNYSLVARLLSLVLGSVALALLLSVGVGLLYYENAADAAALKPFLISVLIAAFLALGFNSLGHKGDLKRIYHKEALCVIGASWLLAAVVGALPYFLILPDCSFIDALFESASGLTTTGASVFTNLESFPYSLMFWRCMSQWIGGLGVVVFFVVILSSLGAGAKILFSGESSGGSAEFDQSRIQSGVWSLILLYLALSALCAITLKLLGMNLYEAVCHTFTTVSTAGFSTRSSSIGAFKNPAIEWALVIFMILGATNFPVMIRLLFRRDTSALRSSTEIHVYYSLIAAAIGLVMLLLVRSGSEGPIGETLRHVVFQVVSIMTTTGFTTVDYDSWPMPVHVLLLALMVVGGSSGSTAGGLKIVRLLVVLRLCAFHIERAFRTHVVRPLTVNARPLAPAAAENVLLYLILSLLVCFGSILIVAFLQPDMSFEGVIATVLAHLFNIGPGFAEGGPTQTYAFLHGTTKLWLTLLMILGRLELYAILVFFIPAFWKSFE